MGAGHGHTARGAPRLRRDARRAAAGSRCERAGLLRAPPQPGPDGAARRGGACRTWRPGPALGEAPPCPVAPPGERER